MRVFWPAAEAAQVDYECLRTAALAGELPDTMVAARSPGAVSQRSSPGRPPSRCSRPE
ncbi:MAG: hypothetical protein M3083_01040 [Actinomycetota bacterium]|nr:hypothetical protein [Actinomycetota bacterium]